MFNILKNADIRNDTSCRHDNNIGWSVEWNEDNDFKDYGASTGTISRLVWDSSYVFATTSGVCEVSPTKDQAPFEGGEYSQVKVVFRVEIPDTTVVQPVTGKIQFQTVSDPAYSSEREVEFAISVDNAYNEYTIDMSEVREWTGNITRIKLFPFIDGAPGFIVHLKSIQATSISNFACDTIYKDNLCDKYAEYSHPCPWVGRGGSCSSATIPSGITITEGVNDKLIVNINEYGDHAVTLSPVSSARPEQISRDIENKLSNTAIAGFFGNKVTVNDRSITITADDTREDISTVTVSDTPAARTLGFYSNEGLSTHTLSQGEDAASEYVAAGTVQLSKSQLARFYVEDQLSSPGIAMDVRRFSTRAGREDYDLGFYDIKVDFSGQTIIDFNNPVNRTGILSSVAFSGDATEDTEFRVFRPKSDGTITHIHSVPMQVSVDTSDAVFEVATSLRVRKGDYVGVFDGKLARAKTGEAPDGSYFIYDGDLKEGNSISGPQKVEQRGDGGLKIFAHGSDKETDAVIDIEFEQLEAVETITVIAEEEQRVEEINLTKAQSGGINGGPHITAVTGLDKFGAQAPAAVNLDALIDGVKFVSDSYIDFHPSWLDGTVSPVDLYDQTSIHLEMHFAKGNRVFFDINRVVLYFTNTFNIKYFSVEYPVTTNDEDSVQSWAPVTSKYSSVSMQGSHLTPDDHPLYSNPVHPTVENFTTSYQALDYNVLDLTFDPVKARSIRYAVENPNFNDALFSGELSNFPLAPSPRIMEIEVFAESIPTASISDNFSFQSSQDGVNFVSHNNVSDTGQASADYLIGYPVKHIKVKFKPQGRLNVNAITASVSQGSTSISSGSLDGTLSLNIPGGDFDSFEKVVATNDSTSTNNYYVNISAQRGTVDRCILWNKLSNEDTTSLSEVGPSPTVIKREPYQLREYNYSYGMPGYILDRNWLINTNAVSYISYDTGGTWEYLGNTLTDYSNATSVTSISPQFGSHPSVYIIVDLGQVYDIETIRHYNSEDTFEINFSPFGGPAFSSLDKDDPNDLDIFADFEGSQSSARWLRYNAFANLQTDTSYRDLTYVDVSLNAASRRNKGKLTWVAAPKLTNYSTANTDPNTHGEGWARNEANFTHWYAVYLESHRNITNIITGPKGSNFLVGDYDTMVPGDVESEYSPSSRANANIAYASSNVSDPAKISWGNLGDEPGPVENWILIKSTTVVDEVIVHVDDNIQKDKEPLASERWWSASIGQVYKDRVEFREARHSIAVDYAANTGPALETLELQQSLGIDHELAARDSLRVLMYISDLSQLDTSVGSITIGRSDTERQEGTRPWEGVEKDEENYYQWSMADIASSLKTGWNELLLPFSGNFRVAQPYFTLDDFSLFSPSKESGKSRFKWFSVAFAGIENNNKLEIKLSGLSVERTKYTQGRFGNALYITGDEYAKFSLDNFNTLEGTVEFYLNPEWSKGPFCNTCEDPREHTIFRAFNDDGFVLALMMTGNGLRVYLTNGESRYFLTDGSNEPIILGQNNHIAITWDLLGTKGIHGLKVYINNVLSTSMGTDVLTAPFKPNSSCVFMLGGTAWKGLLAAQASSVDGSVENLKIFNFAKTDFSESLSTQGLQHVRPSEELVEISVDGVNFYGSGDRGSFLPAIVRDVPPGGSFNIYIRNRDNSSVQGSEKNRTSYIEVVRSST